MCDIMKIMNGVNSIKEILNKITNARKGKSGINTLNKIIQKMDDQKYEYILYRLNKQIEIVKKYNPSVRPAIDPYVSSELGVYGGLSNIEDYGALMNYPDCCVKSFETARFGIDAEHLKEAELIKKEIKKEVINGKIGVKDKCAIILPSGFIPCSLKCKNAIERNLIDIVSYDEHINIIELENELGRELPHYHGAYDEYYEKIILL